MLQVTSDPIVQTSLFPDKCPTPAANLPDEFWVINTSVLLHMKIHTFSDTHTQFEMLLLMTNTEWSYEGQTLYFRDSYMIGLKHACAGQVKAVLIVALPCVFVCSVH